MLVDTKVKHSLADSAYNARRQECAEGVSLIKQSFPKVGALRDVSHEMLQEVVLPNIVQKRCSHVVEENERVVKAGKYLEAGELDQLGQLIWQSHEGLSEKYEVSCDELDFVVALAKAQHGVKGARMMGGGFGGCCLVLIEKVSIAMFKEIVRAEFTVRFNHAPEFYEFDVVDGASEIVN